MDRPDGHKHTSPAPRRPPVLLAPKPALDPVNRAKLKVMFNYIRSEPPRPSVDLANVTLARLLGGVLLLALLSGGLYGLAKYSAPDKPKQVQQVK